MAALIAVGHEAPDGGEHAPLPRSQYQPMLLEQEKPRTPCWMCPARCRRCCGVVCLSLLVASFPVLFLCRFRFVQGEVLSAALVPYLDGRVTLNWWNLPRQRTAEQLEACRNSLSGVYDLGGMLYGTYPGKDAVELLYNCTHVPEVVEDVPWQLRGVFWMRNNGMGEELATLQFGQWFAGPRTHVAPQAPFSWAWAKTAPRHAPAGGLMYRDWVLNKSLTGLAGSHTSFTFTFDACPGKPDIPVPLIGLPGGKCPAGTGASPQLTFARAESHGWGNVTGDGSIYGEYTLEDEATGAQPASRWHRGIFSGIGRCKCIDFGSYDLVKLMDGDGKPVEPHYSEWVQYIGDVDLVMWSDYTDPQVEVLFKQERIEEGKELMMHGESE